MTLSEKYFFPISEICELVDCSVDDLLHLAESGGLVLSVAVEYWPILWGKVEEDSGMIIPVRESWESGYFDLLTSDVSTLRIRRSLSLSYVSKVEDGVILIGCILRGLREFHGRHDECQISANGLWLSRQVAEKLMSTNLERWAPSPQQHSDEHSPSKNALRKMVTEYRNQQLREEASRIGKTSKRLNNSTIAKQIAKSEFGQGLRPETIRKIIGLKK